MKFFAATLIAVFGFALGCSHHQPVAVETNSYPEVRGDFTADQKVTIDFAFSKLPQDFLYSLRILNVVADHEHFEFLYVGQKRYAIGHVCGDDDLREVCIRSDSVTSDVVWHEIGHIYSHTSFKFEREWERTAGNVYDDHYEDYIWETPSEGLLTYYSRRNHYEDIAEWVENCYIYLYVDQNHWVFQNSNLKKDKRYLKKLVLLEKYGFVSYSDYKKLKPLFE